jgi:hypothetical protein
VAVKAIGDIKLSRPKDFFDLQISPGYISSIRKGTNYQALAEGVGIGVMEYEKREFGDFVPFEFYNMIGLLFANGLNPRPVFESWFSSQPSHPLMSNTLLSCGVVDKMVHGRRALGLQRCATLLAFLTLSNYQLNPAEEQQRNPIWKVQSLIDELNHCARKCWMLRKVVAIDKQTIGSKGQCEMKLFISYKREGDGFQCDALCDDGYTFSFFFQHGNAPKLWTEYDQLDLLDTVKCFVWLAEQLPNIWTRIYMNKFYNSQKFCFALFITKCLGHGIACPTGWGIPDGI